MALTKILNDENNSYKPVLTDKLVYDTKPTVNSFNGITSDAVARAIAGASGEVPAVTESDNGKVLTAVYDEGGPAVEWAEASSGSGDVTTADGYFRLGGSTPVKVNYTGSVEQVVTPESLDVDDHTKYRSYGGSSGNMICVWFDNTDGLKDLGTDYTATLKMKTASLLSGFPAGVTVNSTTPVFYCNNSYWDAPQGPTMSGQLAVTDNDVKEQTITVSGPNQAGATSGYGATIGFAINIVNAIDPVTGSNYDLTDALDALIENIEAGNVFELVWPNLTPGTDLLTTIPNVPTPNNQSNKFLKSVQTGQDTWEMQWATINQVPNFSSFNAGNVLTVNQYGSATVWAAPTNTLPTSAVGDVGKVLTVDSQGTPGWAAPASPYASFNTTFDLIDAGSHNSWYAYVQQSSSPAPTIDLPEGVYAYRVEAGLIASAAVDDVYNIEVRVGNGSEPRDCKAVGLQSDSDNVVSIWSSGIIQIVSGSGISKARISVKVSPAKSSGASSAVFPQGSVQLKLARL